MRKNLEISLHLIKTAMLFCILLRPSLAEQGGFLSGNKAAAPMQVWVAPIINTHESKILPYGLREKLRSTLLEIGQIQLIQDSAALSKTLEYYGNETSICIDLSCIVEVGRQVQAQRVLYAEITPNEKKWNVALRWLESPSGGVVRHQSQTLDFNNLHQAEHKLNQMIAHVAGKKKMTTPVKEKPGTFIVRRKMVNPKGPPKKLTEKSGLSPWVWLTSGTSALAGIALATWYFIPKEATPAKVNMSREVVLE